MYIIRFINNYFSNYLLNFFNCFLGLYVWLNTAEIAAARGKETTVLMERNKLLVIRRGSIQALREAVDHAEDIIGGKEGYDWRPTVAQENAALSEVDTRGWKQSLVDYLLGAKRGNR